MSDAYARYIRDDEILFKYALGRGAIRGKEFHEYHEILLVLGGEAEFYSERLHTTLRANQLVVIPQRSYHQFSIPNDEDRYHRCVFNFYDIPGAERLAGICLQEVSVITVNAKERFLVDRVIEASEKDLPDAEKRLIMRSVLTLLLNELSGRTSVGSVQNVSPLTAECLDLINRNLCGALTVTEAAKTLNVSPSTLAHSFKKDMNISVYRYILKKRLTRAHQRLLNGEAASVVASECGFSDYSGFYKQYKKMFGAPPSQKNVSSSHDLFTVE